MNDLSPEARALIEDARPAERPDMSAKSRVRAALAAQLSMPPGPPPQPRIPPAASAAGAGVATKLVLVCALTTTAVVGGVGVRHWIASSRAPERAGQSPLRPGAPSLAPAAPSEARSLPPASNAVPIAEAQGAALPPSAPLDRSRTTVLHRSPSPNPNVARPSSLQRRREQSAPMEHFVPAQNDLRGGTPFLLSPPQVRTGETKVTATHPTMAAPGEAARGAPVAYADSRPVPMEPSTTAPLHAASPRPPELDETGSGRLPWAVRHFTAPAARPLPARVGCSAKEELRLLGAAQIALREGRAKLALATLDQHTARCPSARFNEEHSTAHILALCLLQEREQALVEATRLATVAPASPQLARLRTSCAAAAVENVSRDKATP